MDALDDLVVSNAHAVINPGVSSLMGTTQELVDRIVPEAAMSFRDTLESGKARFWEAKPRCQIAQGVGTKGVVVVTGVSITLCDGPEPMPRTTTSSAATRAQVRCAT